MHHAGRSPDQSDRSPGGAGGITEVWGRSPDRGGRSTRFSGRSPTRAGRSTEGGGGSTNDAGGSTDHPGKGTPHAGSGTDGPGRVILDVETGGNGVGRPFSGSRRGFDGYSRFSDCVTVNPEAGMGHSRARLCSCSQIRHGDPERSLHRRLGLLTFYARPRMPPFVCRGHWRRDWSRSVCSPMFHHLDGTQFGHFLWPFGESFRSVLRG